MSRLDDRIRNGLREPGFERPAKPDSDRVVADVRRRRARQHVVRTAQFGALAVVVLLATGGGFALLQRAFRVDVIAPGSATPTASVAGELGLGPICRVSSMPIVTTSGEGTAWVFERSSDAGCPDANEGDWGVGVDIDGDDLADASTGPLADCFMLCEAFAAPDVDGDGFSEVAVSTAGADGYGVWLYHVTFSPPAIEPIQVDNAISEWPKDGPLEFAWVGAAAHRESARCEVVEGSPTFVLETIEAGELDATITSTILRISGGSATVEDVAERTLLHSELEQMGEVPGNRLCGSPVLEEDEPTPAPMPEGRDIGIGVNVCAVERLSGLALIVDDVPDTAWTGYRVNEQGHCRIDSDVQRWLVAVDVTGDGRPDAKGHLPLVNCPYTMCAPLGATDLDADGDGELVVTALFSIRDQGYFSIVKTDAGYAIEPILVASPGHPVAGIEPGEPLTTSTAGDAGYASWIRCEGYPQSPVLVFTFVDSVVESNRPALWHEVKLQLLADGMFHVVDATDLSLPPGDDPGLIRSSEPACGLNFNLWNSQVD